MKRITLSIITSILFIFLLIGCSSNDDTASTNTSDEEKETTDEKVNEEESNDNSETDAESSSHVNEENIRATNEGDGYFQIKAKRDGKNYEFGAQKRVDDDVVTGEFSIRKN